MQIWPMLENERRAAACGGLRHVRVVEHDERTLAAKLQRETLHRVGGGAHHRLAGANRGGGRDHPHVGMGGERGAGDRVSRRVVQHACRQARLLEAARDEADGERRLVRRLDDQRTARRERRADLPGVEIDGIVPWRDRADDADGRRHNQTADVRARRGAQAPLDAPPLLGVIADHLDSEANLLLGIRQRLALLARQKIGDVGDAGLDRIGRAMQDSRTRVRMRGGPAGQRAPGRLHGRVDVGGACERRRADALAGGGVGDVETGAVAGGRPAAVDE